MIMKKNWHACSITIRIGVLISMAITTGILLVVIAKHTLFKKAHLETFNQQQFITLKAYAEIIDADLATKLTLLKAVADGMAPHTVADPPSAQAYLWTRPGLIKMFDDGLMILSPQGVLMAETPIGDQRRIDNDFSDEPWFHKAHTSNSPVISEPFFSFKGDFYPIVVFIAPIRDSHNTTIAYLGGGLRLNGDNILGQIPKHQNEKKDCFYLFSPDRAILVHRLPQRTLEKDIPVGAIPLFDQAIAGFDGSGETVNLEGVPTLSSFYHLKTVPWILSANTPRSEVMTPFYKSQWGNIAIILSCGALAIFLSWVALLRFTKPLFRFAEHMKSGADTELPIVSSNGPELNRIIQNYNQMLARIKNSQAALAANEELQRTIISSSTDIICIKDEDGRWLLANHACLTLFHLQEIAYKGKKDSELAADGSLDHNIIMDFASSDEITWKYGTMLRTEERILRQDQPAIIMEVVKTPIFYPDGRRKSLVLIGCDITNRKYTENQLRHLAQAVRQSSVAIIITDLAGNIEFANPQFTKITGYSMQEIMGKNPRILKTEKNSPELYRELWQTISAGHTWKGELHNRKKTGEEFVEWATISPILNEQGKITHYLAIKEDITDKKQSEAIIWRQANFDALTDLPNRRMFAYRLENAIRDSKRARSSFALLFLDLDHFKNVNDALGHDQGDILLIEASERLLKCVRDTDTVARLGGDEFVILLTNTNLTTGISSVMEKILASLSEPFSLDNKEMRISVSIGAATYPQNGNDSMTLLKNADRAMYFAKASGRNCWKSLNSDFRIAYNRHSR